MKKIIDDLKWKPMWISHLGCLKGCLEYLGSDISDAWLYGASGHAFILNIHKVVCPSGPTAWRKEQFLSNLQNIGIVSQDIVAHKTMRNFHEKQKLAFESTTKAIDNGIPCIGWELNVPEYYVINGYDENGYFFSGPEDQEKFQPKKWDTMGDSDIGILEVSLISLGEALNDKIILRDALQFAVDFSSSPAAWLFQDYKAGSEGYNLWINAIKSKTADVMGVAYNAAVWTECRVMAEKFLLEAKQRIGGELSNHLAISADLYREVSENLKEVTEQFPFLPFPIDTDLINDEQRCNKAIDFLQKAKLAEEKALALLPKILEKLPGTKQKETECE